jgi:hypothetical protein
MFILSLVKLLLYSMLVVFDSFIENIKNKLLIDQIVKYAAVYIVSKKLIAQSTVWSISLVVIE